MKYWSIVLIVIIVALGGVISVMLFWPKVDMSFAVEGETFFKYEAKDISHTMSANDLRKICDLFNGKKLYSDDLSCGFSDNISIVINGSDRFCFACDSCPIVYWKNKNKFLRLSESEYDELVDILASYGFSFPCV